MKPLYTQTEFEEAKSTDKLPCECYSCKSIFYQAKKNIKQELTHNRGRVKYCSLLCLGDNKTEEKTKIINCTNCDKQFEKILSQIKKSTSGNHFCSLSCSTSFNNKNKSHGTKRSKLEAWIEDQLTTLYPNLDIHFNQKDAIGSELDIYIPSLNIAFELNGIFHYEPIFGVDKLNQIQENDVSKSKACIDAQIDLCIIDTSAQKYVKPKTSQKYLDIITNIVNERILLTT